jgi:hypothetical protein
MDRVRFGRALGYGARAAAKTLVTAVDAATAENPTPRRTPPAVATPPVRVRAPQARSQTGPGAWAAPVRPVAQAVQSAGRIVAQGQAASKAVRRERKRFGQAMLEPFVRLSGVLGLELAGVFFGIFALCGLAAVWKLRGDWRASSPEHAHLLGAAAMMGLFGYFCVSSFLRARRREKGR